PVLVIWTGAFYIFLQFAPTGLDPYQTLPMQPRYILPIVVLLFFPLGFLLARLSEAKPLGISGTVLLLAAVALQGFNVTFQRISRGVYFSDMPNAVSAVLQSRAVDWPKRPGISLDAFRRLPHDLKSRVQDWPRIDWGKDFLCSDGGAWLASVNAVL